MDDVEKASKDTATVPPAHCFPLNLQGIPLFPLPLTWFFVLHTESIYLCTQEAGP